MICPKCGRKYEDYMLQCPWCDKQNPKFAKKEEPIDNVPVVEEPVADKPVAEASVVETAPYADEPECVSSALLFWICYFVGEFGVHSFISGRIKRGVLYLLATIIVSAGFLYANLCDSEYDKQVYLCFWIFDIVVIVLNFIEMWKMSCGKYADMKTGKKFKAKKWMKGFFFVCVIVSLLLNCITLMGHMQVNTSDLDGDGIAVDFEDYMERENKFFTENGRLGSLSEIHFPVQTSKFIYSDDKGWGMMARYWKLRSDCPIFAAWKIYAKVKDEKLEWFVDVPANPGCDALAPNMRELKKKIETAK